MNNNMPGQERTNEAVTYCQEFNKEDGWIQVTQQRIIVHDPVNGGKYATLTPLLPVKIKINNKEVLTKAKVSSTDSISWEIEEQPLYEITLSEDKLLACLYLVSKERHPWYLAEVRRETSVTLRAEMNKNIVLETVDLSQVVNKLDQMAIKADIDFAAIQQELLLPSHHPVIVAQGKAPIHGKDARLEIYFSQQLENQFFEVAGTINFRDHLRIPSVKEGEVMARKIPLVEGIPGYDVVGFVKAPSPPKDISVHVKSNVEITEDGTIIARKQGRPRMTGDKTKFFDISTSYVIPGNVDIETGNIVFSGDVIVQGDVTDNMTIESLGNVYIFGSVYNSAITATGSINIRGNIIASKLYSGYFGMFFSRLYHTSKLLCDSIERLLSASQLLVHTMEAKKQPLRYGQVILLLLENKMREIPDAIKELLIVLTHIQHIKQEDYENLKRISEIFIKPDQLLEIATYSFVQNFLTLLQDTYGEVARMQEEKAEISINQCHKSELKSKGDIVIHRDGVLLCDLLSARSITFRQDNSICRGSTLEAGDSISAGIVGGQTVANSVLKAQKRVHVRRLYSGRVCVGKYCKDLFEVVENITFDSFSMKRRV
ncbi:DUF342 domain-containing protein [Cohnella sp.]|uniref:DUF342 domain-containing protein n=1 Tax=Cohnella sp. TaxID=1883426 RepID=UPI0035664FBE